jgi:hypothetical protein
MDPTDLIPERRAKSWKREHEERCRRHQNNNDLKKFRDPGCGSDQSVLPEIKSDSVDFVKDAVEVEKMETSASDKFLNCSGIDDVENEDIYTLRTTIEDSVNEYESSNKALTEYELISNCESGGRILCDDRRNEIVFPFPQTTEGSDFKTESNLLVKQYLEKKGREDLTEKNYLQMGFKGNSTKPGHTSSDSSVCENVMEEQSNSSVISQQVETEALRNVCEEYSEISRRAEEVFSESSGSPVSKGTELIQLEEALPGVEEIMDMPLEIPQGTQLEFSGIPEGDPTGLADVKPETLGGTIPKFVDILKDATPERVSQGQPEFTDILQRFSGDFRTVSECSVNTQESSQRTDVSLDTEHFGNCGEGDELTGSHSLKLGVSDLSQGTLLDRDFEIVDLLDSSQNIGHIDSSGSDLENRNGVPNEHLKGNLENDDQKGSVDTEDSILCSSEAPGNVAENLNENGTLSMKQKKNLFMELSHEENSVRPVEYVDKPEHSVCVLGSARSPSPFQERKQSASKVMEGPGTSEEIKKFLTDCSSGNVTEEYKTINDNYKGTKQDTEELSEENSKHIKDEAAVEITGDTFHKYMELEGTSSGSKYCLGIDSVPDQTSALEMSSLQPSATASEDRVSFLLF